MGASVSSPAADLPLSVRIPFVELLGFRLRRWDDGEAEIAYDPAPEHLNSFGVVHGGASMTLLDVVMAHAARSVQRDMGVVTIEMKTSFMQAAQGPLVARARLLHRTATMAFTEGQVRDAAGRLCAHASGTFRYVRRLPTPGAGVRDLQTPATDAGVIPTD
ncbi:1,4-dihydroxy-2-naphthoyl-CoA hydrolase [Tepidimonas thermarum]|uniref:1,4-dihydroxy-2-naphthoyl-CoA hydrolase n=1 Tax=Tepidimonas thermarum TaxID=335431 RepID=A0A554X934_9BURK|nr:PaaI family thioesterase [Tepidimonas thermarum]TSE32337.1 1,4-dihydroxy-2-naphthoyl-CoA hydrolase [Tepidimonas thermarum]